MYFFLLKKSHRTERKIQNDKLSLTLTIHNVKIIRYNISIIKFSYYKHIQKPIIVKKIYKSPQQKNYLFTSKTQTSRNH